MGTGLIVTVYAYVTEGFFASMPLLWIFSAITIGIGKGSGLLPEADTFGSVNQETREEWKAEDKFADACEGKCSEFKDGTRGTIRGNDMESSMEKWGFRL